jgi:hypothetical protein
MLAQEDLETLLHDLESDRVERTMPIRLAQVGLRHFEVLTYKDLYESALA